MKLHHYYVQLEGILQDLEDDISDLISNEAKEYFNILIRKITMFGHESEQIWEYTSQIRDIYQQQLDVHQNAVMKFLTVVTTLFMPLTLIVGWYGMNFEHMPELEFKYSYPIVLVLVFFLLLLCVIFKRKNGGNMPPFSKLLLYFCAYFSAI
ncbi:MAG: CorA family divalent cation transporter [Eubacterium ventriosum]